MEGPGQLLPEHARGARGRWLFVTAGAVALLSRALFLPPTLEDIDSVNFALALERFDPRLHQPHPPGYPVYVALARLVHTLVKDPPQAMGLLSALAQAILVLPLFSLFRRLAGSIESAALSVLLALACPILWFNGARPMSDSLGLLFIVSAQALLLRSLAGGSSPVAASLLTGLALGVRAQTGLLTLPLWFLALARQRRWAPPLAALALGMGLWALPLMWAAGGPAEYLRAFGQTMSDAAGSEPLLTHVTLNRTVRSLFHVGISPWVSPGLGVTVAALATLGCVTLFKRRPDALALAGLAFGPYLVFHTLVQQVSTLRYSLPYLPLLAWLAVEGGRRVGEWLGRPVWTGRLLVAGGVGASAMLTIPALTLYHLTPSPPYAALAMVEKEASPPRDFVLAGHYMFSRYFDLAPDGLQVLRATPGEAIPLLSRHFRSGDHRRVLFLSNPRRTDLAAFSRGAGRILGRWDWPEAVRPFLSGERPNEAELFSIETPWFFSSDGWLLSLESGRMEEVGEDPERDAYLRPTPGPSFLILAGVPTGPVEGCGLEVSVPGLLDATASCREPLLRGYLLPPGGEATDYLKLTVASSKGDVPAGMPFALVGLDYGPASAAGFVQGEGWFFPERDENLRRFRWASALSRALLHVPEGGALLVIEGVAPLEYLGKGAEAEISEQGVVLTRTPLTERRFRMEARIEAGSSPFHEIVLSVNRSFVPDVLQRNGDRRRLALRVYNFQLTALPGPRPESAEASGSGARVAARPRPE